MRRFSHILVVVVCIGFGYARAQTQPISRDAIINSAQNAVDYSYWWGHGCWRQDGAQHGSCSGSCPDCTHTGSYGADCSGFAAKVWQVPGPSPIEDDAHPYSTNNFRNETTHWSQVSRDEALRGDCFVYRNSSNTAGHILVFESGDPWGDLWTYEARGCSYGIVHNLRSLSASYVAIRREQVDQTPQTGTIRGVVYVDHGQGSADMSERIPGATVSCEGIGSTTAADGDAGWSFSLPAGSYTITAEAAGYDPGSRECAVALGSEQWCSIGLFPEGQPNCRPACEDLDCGPDPLCGASCGDCPDGEVCNINARCVLEGETCHPDCTSSQCGRDPVCGDSCGMCPPDKICSAGQCQPISATLGKLYGYVLLVDAGDPDNPRLVGPVASAALKTDNGFAVRSFEDGYYELQVTPGEVLLTATAPDGLQGQTTCDAVAGEASECPISIITLVADDVAGGCGCSTRGQIPATLLPIMVTGLILRRRKKIC